MLKPSPASVSDSVQVEAWLQRATATSWQAVAMLTPVLPLLLHPAAATATQIPTDAYQLGLVFMGADVRRSRRPGQTTGITPLAGRYRALDAARRPELAGASPVRPASHRVPSG